MFSGLKPTANPVEQATTRASATATAKTSTGALHFAQDDGDVTVRRSGILVVRGSGILVGAVFGILVGAGFGDLGGCGLRGS